jgi:hypothetical protein
MMNAVERIQRNVQPPDPEAWDKQMAVVRVFDALVYDGRRPSDLLITNDWQAWIIGPSQAFRPAKTLESPADLTKTDRKLLTKMRTLDKDVLTMKLGRWLTSDEIDALYARAAQIADVFDRDVAVKGAPAVLFDFDRSGSRCVL